MKPFKTALNLDDESECVDFLRVMSGHGSPTGSGRRMARQLGFKGTGSAKAARALWNYAMNRNVAFTTRKEGRIATALQYEAICDRIYRQSIQPHIECW